MGGLLAGVVEGVNDCLNRRHCSQGGSGLTGSLIVDYICKKENQIRNSRDQISNLHALVKQQWLEGIKVFNLARTKTVHANNQYTKTVHVTEGCTICPPEACCGWRHI